ncbi:hypothetical protein [Aneurinibacillus sp. REN35]
MIKKTKMLVGLLALVTAFGITGPYVKDTTAVKGKPSIGTFAHHGG